MTVVLQHLILYNFKSFRGKVLFGPIRNMSVIVGANGSGKSNIMDALSFVLGGNSPSVRCKKLSDLIHGASSGKPISSSAHVSAVFALSADSNRTFTRIIKNNSSEYQLDGQVVSTEAYFAALKEIGISVQGRNCLVSQGTIESILMKSPKSLCEFFEEVSGSIRYKAEYNRLMEESNELKTKMHYVIGLKKSMIGSKKNYLKAKKEADRYRELHEKHLQLKSQLQLFELYHIKREVGVLMEEERNEKVEINRLLAEKEDILTKRKKKKNEIRNLFRQLELAESDLCETEHGFKCKEADMNSVKEEIAFWETKLKNANVTLTEKHSAYEAHVRSIEELQEELREIERMRTEYEESVATELSSQGSSVELTTSQAEEYLQLKVVVQNESSAQTKDMDDIRQEQNIDQYMLDNEERKKADLVHKLNCKKIIKEEAEKRIKKLQQSVNENTHELEKATRRQTDFSAKLKKFKEERADIQKEINEVHVQLKDAADDKEKTSRFKRKTETLHLMQNLYPGVYGRVSQLCKPIHSRYNVAVAKVFGKYLNAIIVDTVDTAKHYINYLKQQKIGDETFLPLDNLHIPILKERLRAFPVIKDVKLLYDVIQMSSERINTAVLFITRNTLVCETLEDAFKVAHVVDKEYRQNCVALDGTLYRTDGTFSGGLTELSKKAKVWKENELENLRARQSALRDRYTEISTMAHVETEVNDTNTQIQGLMVRLKYIRCSLEEATRTLGVAKNEIKVFSQELDLVCSTIASINDRMKERNQSMRDIERVVNNIEDEVYASFCKKIGVRNVRQYEQRDLIRYHEQQKRKLDFDEQYDRILNTLNYAMERDTRSAVTKSEKAVEVIVQRLEAIRSEEPLAKHKYNEGKRALQEKTNACTTIKAGLVEQERKSKEFKEKIKTISELIGASESKHIGTRTNIERKKVAVLSLIKDSKMTGIAIPYLNENTSTFGDSSTGLSTPSPESIFDEILRVDFSQLPEELQTGNVDGDRLKDEIIQIEDELNLIDKPDMKVDGKLELAQRKMNEFTAKSEDIRKAFNKTSEEFELIKKKRLDTFNESFEYISNQLEEAYKRLYKDGIVTALIVPEDSAEPYLGGLHFSCIAPGKRLQPLNSLSGGERTFASLALLFSLNSYKPTPFFAFDEIDAALDENAVNNLIDVILEKKVEMQFIIVSLGKIKLYADALYGVALEPDSQTVESVLFTLDLSDMPLPEKEKDKQRKSNIQS